MKEEERQFQKFMEKFYARVYHYAFFVNVRMWMVWVAFILGIIIGSRV